MYVTEKAYPFFRRDDRKRGLLSYVLLSEDEELFRRDFEKVCHFEKYIERNTAGGKLNFADRCSVEIQLFGK